MKTSSYYAAGSAVYRMVEAFILDRKEVLPCAAYLEGEYGVKGLYAGVPVMIGGGGVEKIITIELTDAEKKAFASSVNHAVRAGRGDGQGAGRNNWRTAGHGLRGTIDWTREE